MSITVSSATNDELTVLWQGLDFVNRQSLQGEWWKSQAAIVQSLLTQVQAQATTNGIWPIPSIDA
jgi:hypothetical protein